MHEHLTASNDSYDFEGEVSIQDDFRSPQTLPDLEFWIEIMPWLYGPGWNILTGFPSREDLIIWNVPKDKLEWVVLMTKSNAMYAISWLDIND